MAKSIRWRLQFWYAVVLLAVVSGFAIYLYYEVRAARLREIDADLVVAVNHLDSTLRTWPEAELGSKNSANRNQSASRTNCAPKLRHEPSRCAGSARL